MQKVVHIHAAGSWSAPVADHVTLDQDGRHRRRIVLTSDHAAITALLDEPETVQLKNGDGLELDDGRILRVIAADEDLLEVRGDSPQHLLQLAWHLGNRHLSTQVEVDRLVIRYDHVIGHMLEHLGARVTRITARFDPEGGAYGGHAHEH
jgi:urease accessory protein